MDWRNSLLVGGATFLVGAVLMEIGDKPKGDIGWWPYVGTFISGAVGFMLLTNEYTPKALELNADETKYTMYGKEYFEKHDEGKNEHKYYALFKIDKEGSPITYWSAYGRLGGYSRAGSIVVTQLNINKFDEMFNKKYKKYDYLGSTIPAEIEVNAIQKINAKWPQMRLGMYKKKPKLVITNPPKSPPKSPPKETDARKARLQKRFGFGAESLAVIDNCLKCKYKGIKAYHIKDMGWWLHCPKCDYRTEIKEGQIAWEVSPDWDKEGKMPSIAPIDVDWACEFIKKSKFVKNFGAEMFDTQLGRGSFGEVFLYKGKALKIVDLEDEDNRKQADFFEKIYLMNQKGMETPDSLVKIIHYNRGTMTSKMITELAGKSIKLGNRRSPKSVGHPIAYWVMELVPTIYQDIPRTKVGENEEEYRDDMRKLNEWTEKNLNYQIGDLHDENLGIREDDSLVVFDPHINRVGEDRIFGFIHVAETNE